MCCTLYTNVFPKPFVLTESNTKLKSWKFMLSFSLSCFGCNFSGWKKCHILSQNVTFMTSLWRFFCSNVIFWNYNITKFDFFVQNVTFFGIFRKPWFLVRFFLGYVFLKVSIANIKFLELKLLAKKSKSKENPVREVIKTKSY